MSPSSFPTHGDHADTPSQPNRSSSGLTLVLPPLSALKAQKSKKKLKLTYEEPVRKTPRPLKLKPLKEVLSKLISQIKKCVDTWLRCHEALLTGMCRKDDYAFFLHPVDLAQVPGYSDVVSRPMDLGTMSTKVDKGKYRSLEEFAVSTSHASVRRLVFAPQYPRSSFTERIQPVPWNKHEPPSRFDLSERPLNDPRASHSALPFANSWLMRSSLLSCSHGRTHCNGDGPSHTR